jgi:hypothetical protein
MKVVIIVLAAMWIGIGSVLMKVGSKQNSFGNQVATGFMYAYVVGWVCLSTYYVWILSR